MAQAARHEEGVGAHACCLGRIALEEAELLHALGNLGNGNHVYVAEGYAGLEGVDGGGVGAVVDIVYHLLTLGEVGAHGHGRGEVTGIVHAVLSTGIEQEELALLQYVAVAVVVEGLSVDGSDDGE